MISKTSESWLNLLCKHRYPDMILVQLTIDIVLLQQYMALSDRHLFYRYISEIHLAIIQFSMQ